MGLFACSVRDLKFEVPAGGWYNGSAAQDFWLQWPCAKQTARCSVATTRGLSRTSNSSALHRETEIAQVPKDEAALYRFVFCLASKWRLAMEEPKATFPWGPGLRRLVVYGPSLGASWA
jgi:hypothetical protein